MTRTETIIDKSRDYRLDLNGNGLDDRLEPPEVNIVEGARELKERLRTNTSTSPALSGGDIDAAWDMAESGGEETAAGSNSTPDQNVVEEIGAALGVTYREDEELNVGLKERERDRHRWELDPASADDYYERAREEAIPRGKARFLKFFGF